MATGPLVRVNTHRDYITNMTEKQAKAYLRKHPGAKILDAPTGEPPNEFVPVEPTAAIEELAEGADFEELPPAGDTPKTSTPRAKSKS